MTLGEVLKKSPGTDSPLHDSHFPPNLFECTLKRYSYLILVPSTHS